MSAGMAPWGFDTRNPMNVPTVRDPFAASNPPPGAPGRAFFEGGWWIVALGLGVGVLLWSRRG